MPDLRGVLADITPLRENPAFRRLWIGTTLSTLGSAMTLFAVTLQVFLLTHSSAAVGGVGLAAAIPPSRSGCSPAPWSTGPTVACSCSTRRASMMIVSVGFAVQAYLGNQHVWLLYAARSTRLVGQLGERPGAAHVHAAAAAEGADPGRLPR